MFSFQNPKSEKLDNFRRGKLLILVAAMVITLSHVASAYFQVNLGNLAVMNALRGNQESMDGVIFVDRASPYLQGVAAYRTSNFIEARSHFQAATSTHYDLARYYMLESALAQGDWETVLTEFDITKTRERIFPIKILAEHGDEIRADQREKYMGMIISDPILSSAYLHQLLTQNRFDEVIEFAPVIPNYAESVQLQLMVGRAYFYKRDYRNSAIVFQNIHTQQPTLDNTIWLGKALFNSGQQEEGLRYLEAILQEPAGRRYIPYLVDLSVAYAVAARCFDAQEVLNGATESDRTGAHRTLLEGAKQTVADRCQG